MLANQNQCQLMLKGYKNIISVYFYLTEENFQEFLDDIAISRIIKKKIG